MRQRNERGQIIANTKEIGGVRYRLCSGPAHSEPLFLPDNDKYFYTRKSGKFKGYRVSRCRLCKAYAHGTPLDIAGLVPLTKIRPFIIEGVNRVGKMEFCRRTGMSQGQLYKYQHGRVEHVYKRVAKRILLEVISMRRKNEVRHRDSIAHGASVRGKSEREIESVRDYYNYNGDELAEAQRRRRREMSESKKEEIRARDRDRKRQRRLSRAA